jgi:glycosyltransferase involved in cell wall biosynthesis
VRPEVSVLLPARNEERAILGAIACIQAQTLTNWELLIVDDGSTDRTVEVARSVRDPRVRVLSGRQLGLPAALNRGINQAQAAYIARQDADDYSYPERLERQIRFLHAHAKVAVLGAAWEEVARAGQPRRPRVPVVAGPLNDVLLLFNPVAHTTAVFRKQIIVELGGYDETLPAYGAEDYDLWLRVAHAGHLIWNLPDVLAVRLMVTSRRREREIVRAELAVRWRDLKRRRDASAPVARAALRLVQRLPMLGVPVALRRAVRWAEGKSP